MSWEQSESDRGKTRWTAVGGGRRRPTGSVGGTEFRRRDLVDTTRPPRPEWTCLNSRLELISELSRGRIQGNRHGAQKVNNYLRPCRAAACRQAPADQQRPKNGRPNEAYLAAESLFAPCLPNPEAETRVIFDYLQHVCLITDVTCCDAIFIEQSKINVTLNSHSGRHIGRQ